jgi:hypothetical protein
MLQMKENTYCVWWDNQNGVAYAKDMSIENNAEMEQDMSL